MVKFLYDYEIKAFPAYFKCLKKVGTVFAKYISEMKIKQKKGRSSNMKKILIATHGTFASGAESTVKFLMGDVGNITCINAYVDQDEIWRRHWNSILLRFSRRTR